MSVIQSCTTISFLDVELAWSYLLTSSTFIPWKRMKSIVEDTMGKQCYQGVKVVMRYNILAH